MDRFLCGELARLRRLVPPTGPEAVSQVMRIVAGMLERARAEPPSNEDEVLATLVHLQGLLEQVAPAPAPAPPAEPAPGPPGSNLSKVPEWVEKVADAIAWIIVAWGIMQAGSWVGYDNWMVALAMGAALVTLFPNLVEPFRRFIRSIVIELFMVLVSLVEAIGRFFDAAGRYYNGNFARMVIEVVLVPVFLRALGDLVGYPAIRQLADWLLGVIKSARELLQQGIDFVQGLVLQVRDALTQALDDLLAWIPQELGRWRDQIEADFRRVFNLALGRLDALEARVDRAVADLGRYLTVTIAGVTTRIDLLEAGLVERVQVVLRNGGGEIVRRYFLLRVARQTDENLADLGEALGESGLPGPLPDVEEAAPWVVVRELTAQLPASPPPVPSGAYDAIQDAVADLRAFIAGTPNPLGPWPPELLDVPPPR